MYRYHGGRVSYVRDCVRSSHVGELSVDDTTYPADGFHQRAKERRRYHIQRHIQSLYVPFTCRLSSDDDYLRDVEQLVGTASSHYATAKGIGMHADSPSCAKGLCEIDELSCTGTILRIDNIRSHCTRVSWFSRDSVGGVVAESVLIITSFMHR
jgi:hypothetical protein